MQQNKATVDLCEDSIYIVCDGELKEIKAPHHGDLVIKMVQGKAKKYDIRESHQIK